MRAAILLCLLCLTGVIYGQEMESDLYAALNNSTLSVFMQSEFNTLRVVTYRASKNLGLVEESSTTYRKGKINPERINFTTNYTEYFLLEDRKKSIGRYDLDANNGIARYERTDFDQRNVRTYTFYHFYTYEHAVLAREFIRTKEYLGTGSVEMDTVVTVDSVIYQVTTRENGISQKDLSEGGGTTLYEISDNRLVREHTLLTGFSEENTFVYDGAGRLVTIENILSGEDGQQIRSRTELRYSIDGLVSEVLFYDQNNDILEKKIFTYR